MGKVGVGVGVKGGVGRGVFGKRPGEAGRAVALNTGGR